MRPTFQSSLTRKRDNVRPQCALRKKSRPPRPFSACKCKASPHAFSPFQGLDGYASLTCSRSEVVVQTSLQFRIGSSRVGNWNGGTQLGGPRDVWALADSQRVALWCPSLIQARLKGGERSDPLPIGCLWTDHGVSIYASAPNGHRTDFTQAEFRRQQVGTKFQVPGNWTCQGHTTAPTTRMSRCPSPGEPPDVPEANPTGLYRRTVPACPKTWKNRRVVVHFGGAESVLYVWLNGSPLGLFQRFAIAHRIRSYAAYRSMVDNTLVAMVIRWSDATYLEDQDHWFMAGTPPRSISLLDTSRVYIADLKSRLSSWTKKTSMADLSRRRRSRLWRTSKEPESGYTIEASLISPSKANQVRTAAPGRRLTHNGPKIPTSIAATGSSRFHAP